MIKFDTYRLLNESLGMYSLGVRPAQSLGIQSNMPGFAEAGLPPELSAKKKFGDQKPNFGDDQTDPTVPPEDDLGGDEDNFGGEEEPEDNFGGDDEGPVDVQAKIAELEAELEKLKAQVAGEEGDDENDDLDHEDDLGDFGNGEEEDLEDAEEKTGMDLDGDNEEGEDEEHKGKVFGKKVTAFMKKEACEDGDLKGKSKDGPVFMMKKAKKCGDGMGEKNILLDKSKKCSTDKKCKKCNANMKKESTGYERPKPLDNSESAWINSLRQQVAQTSVNQKFDDGMSNLKREDLLLPPPSLEPIPEPNDLTAEAVQEILSRLARLEKR